MPKAHGTRKQRAMELLVRLEVGPARFLDNPTPGQAAEARTHYETWCNTWVIPVIKRLIPELKKH